MQREVYTGNEIGSAIEVFDVRGNLLARLKPENFVAGKFDVRALLADGVEIGIRKPAERKARKRP